MINYLSVGDISSIYPREIRYIKIRSGLPEGGGDNHGSSTVFAWLVQIHPLELQKGGIEDEIIIYISERRNSLGVKTYSSRRTDFVFTPLKELGFTPPASA